MPYKNKEDKKTHGLIYYSKHRIAIIKRATLWNKQNKERRNNRRNWDTDNARESSRKRQIKHRQTEKGRINKSKCYAKRKRNLGFIPMFDNPFDKSELIDWHHINDAYVVAIPRDLHHQYMGKFHREKTMGIIKQIYLNGE